MAIDSLTGLFNKTVPKKTLTVEFDQDQTAAVVLTPTSGKSIAVKGVYVGTESTDGSVRLFFTDDEDDAENTVFKAYGGDENPGYVPMIITGDKDATLKITSDFGAGDNYFVLVNYDED